MKKPLISALFTALFCFGASVSALASDSTFLVISESADSLPADIDRVVADRGGEILFRVPQIGLAVARAPDAGFPFAFDRVKSLRAVIPDFLHNLPDGEMTIAAANPPTSGDDDFFFDLQWGHDAVNAPEAWEAGVTGAGTRVAVLDTGIDATHPDLAPNVNTLLGGSFLADPLPGDWYGHGTHVAGTIAAADNTFGVIGIAPEAELVSVQVCGPGGCPTSAIVTGLVYSALIDADVANMSLGGYGRISNAGFVKACKEDGNPMQWCAAQQRLYLQNVILIYKRAIQFARDMGVTVVVAAGNESTDADHDMYYGERYPSLRLGFADYPGVIAVAATAPVNWCNFPDTDPDIPTLYTNYGRSVIDFSAPGGEFNWFFPNDTDPCTVAGVTAPAYLFDGIVSTVPGGWAWASGTSMAAPHVSGLAALLISENGGSMAPDEVKAGLKANAEDVGAPGKDPYHGNGAARSGY